MRLNDGADIGVLHERHGANYLVLLMSSLLTPPILPSIAPDYPQINNMLLVIRVWAN